MALGLLIGFVFYTCYAAARDVWGNPTLILAATFIGINVPQYSKLSNRIEEWLQALSAILTLGRLGRFAFQMAFNTSLYALFAAGGVVAPVGFGALGGLLGAAAVTTFASQGAQYAGQAAYRLGYGHPDWNTMVGISANVFMAAMALAGFPIARVIFLFCALIFGSLVFGMGVTSDLRARFQPKGGIAVFFGTFNPFHVGHLELVRRVIAERRVEKVVIHPTIVPKLHAEAFARGEIKVARTERGMQVYETTEKADPFLRYFPTGNVFYCPEDRLRMIELAIADAGLSGRVEMAFMPGVYRKGGFRGVFREIRRLNPRKRIHGIHGSDIGGMMVRNIMDESGWYYPFSVVRKGDVSATAIRGGREGLTSPSVAAFIRQMRDRIPAAASL